MVIVPTIAADLPTTAGDGVEAAADFVHTANAGLVAFDNSHRGILQACIEVPRSWSPRQWHHIQRIPGGCRGHYPLERVLKG